MKKELIKEKSMRLHVEEQLSVTEQKAIIYLTIHFILSSQNLSSISYISTSFYIFLEWFILAEGVHRII